MKRLPFIYWACPLTLALDTLPRFFSPLWTLVTAGALAVALWAAVWVRLYTTKRLRPEFSLLCVLPQTLGYALHYLQQSAPEEAAAYATPFWQNLHMVLWLGLIWVGINTIKPDEAGKKAWRDPVTLFMSIILIFYAVTQWGATAFSLFLPAQS